MAHIPWYLFAGLSYVARMGMPSEPNALSEHDGIALSGVQGSFTWRLRVDELMEESSF
jgi:hypothetical protein